MISTIVLILRAILLIAISISLAAVEAAFYLVKRRRLAHLAVNNPRAELVNRYLEDPPSLLMPIHIGTYTAHVGITVVITAMFLERLQHWAIVVAFGAMVIYLLLLRLTLPYSLVRRNPERSLLAAAARSSTPTPSSWIRWCARCGAGPAASPPPPRTKRCRRRRPRCRPRPCTIPDEDRLLKAVVRFANTHVKDVMTPRPDIVALPASATIGDLTRLIRETKYSRIPVFGENLDDIVGVVTVRDLIDHEGPPSDPLRPLVRPALLVPETKKIAELLQEFQAGRITFAVVIDEYGGTAGLVTVEDIVEEIVGEIKDEYDLEAEPIVVEPDGAVLVAGRVNVDRLEQALEVPLAEGDNVDTVGGLVASRVRARPPHGGAHGLQGVHHRGRLRRAQARQPRALPAQARRGRSLVRATGRPAPGRRSAPRRPAPRSPAAERSPTPLPVAAARALSAEPAAPADHRRRRRHRVRAGIEGSLPSPRDARRGGERSPPTSSCPLGDNQYETGSENEYAERLQPLLGPPARDQPPRARQPRVPGRTSPRRATSTTSTGRAPSPASPATATRGTTATTSRTGTSSPSTATAPTSAAAAA